MEVLGESNELASAQKNLLIYGLAAALAILFLLQASFGSLRLVMPEATICASQSTGAPACRASRAAATTPGLNTMSSTRSSSPRSANATARCWAANSTRLGLATTAFSTRPAAEAHQCRAVDHPVAVVDELLDADVGVERTEKGGGDLDSRDDDRLARVHLGGEPCILRDRRV